MDLKTLQTANLSRVHFVHVEVGVLLQLVLPYAVREDNLKLVFFRTMHDHLVQIIPDSWYLFISPTDGWGLP